MLPSKLSFHFMPMVEPQVPSVTQVMVYHTLFQYLRVSKSHMLLRVTMLPVEPLPITARSSSIWMVSLNKVVYQLGNKLLEKSRRRNASSPSILQRLWKKPDAPTSTPRTTNSQTVKSLKLTNQDSWDQKLYSSQIISNKVVKSWVSTK